MVIREEDLLWYLRLWEHVETGPARESRVQSVAYCSTSMVDLDKLTVYMSTFGGKHNA